MQSLNLQAKNYLISQQEKELDHLAATLSAWIVIESSADLDDTTHCIFGRWAVSYQNVINYIFDRGMFIQDLYTNKLSAELQAQVTRIVGNFIVQVVDSIIDIQAECDSANLASENLPPTLPHKLIKLPTCEFTSIIVNHVEHFKKFWSEEMIDELERQHYRLLLEYQRDIALKSALDKCDSITSFEIG